MLGTVGWNGQGKRFTPDLADPVPLRLAPLGYTKLARAVSEHSVSSVACL